MPSTVPDRIRRAILLLIVALPLLIGAVYVGVKPGFDANARTPRVAIALPRRRAGLRREQSAGRRPHRRNLRLPLADRRCRQRRQAPVQRLAARRGHHPGEVRVHLDPATDPSTRQVTIVPGRQDIDAATYARLVQTVTDSAGKIGVNDLLVRSVEGPG